MDLTTKAYHYITGTIMRYPSERAIDVFGGFGGRVRYVKCYEYRALPKDKTHEAKSFGHLSEARKYLVSLSEGSKIF